MLSVLRYKHFLCRMLFIKCVCAWRANSHKLQITSSDFTSRCRMNENSRTSRRGKGCEKGGIDRLSAGELRGPKPSICFGLRHVELPIPCIRMQSTRELYSIALGPTINCYQLRKHPLPFGYRTSLGCMYTYHLAANAAEKRKGRLT